MTFQVDSEVGQLRQAIVHRPGLELSRLTPENIGALLFDDVMWAAKAKEEHDAFAEKLREMRGAGPPLRSAAGRDARGGRGSDVRARPPLHLGHAGAVAVGPGASPARGARRDANWLSTSSGAFSRQTCTRGGPRA